MCCRRQARPTIAPPQNPTARIDCFWPRTGGHDADECQLVHPDDVVARLRAFVEAETRGRGGQPSVSPVTGSVSRGPGTTGAAAATALCQEGGCAASGAAAATAPHAASGSRAVERERAYWARVAGAVGERSLRAWNRLEAQLGAYHGLLVRRSAGLAAVHDLSEQNEELRTRLNACLTCAINSELRVPPTTLML